jgi:hypothetical protein
MPHQTRKEAQQLEHSVYSFREYSDGRRKCERKTKHLHTQSARWIRKQLKLPQYTPRGSLWGKKVQLLLILDLGYRWG